MDAAQFLASPGPNPHGCGWLPPPGGIYVSHCSRHHDDSPRYGAHGSVSFDCEDGGDCPCDRDGEASEDEMAEAVARAWMFGE